MLPQPDYWNETHGGDGATNRVSAAFGRETGDGGLEALEGVEIPDRSEVRRSRRILDELRRRRGERQRPPLELDYIDRLLRRF